MNENKAFVTGHRPDKLFGYNMNDERYNKIKEWLKGKFIEHNIKEVYDGMALGVDIIACEAVLELKDAGYDIKLHACVPFNGYEKRWNSEDVQKYYAMLERADEVDIVTDAYWEDGCSYLTDRNHFMVDNTSIGFAVINGGLQKTKLNKTGTMECIKYAQKKKMGVEIFDIYDLVTKEEKEERKEDTKEKKKTSKKKANTITLEALELWRDMDNFIILDLETTGFSYASGCRIIDIGAFEVKDNIITSKYEQLVNPGVRIPPNIVQLTGINDIMVSRKPTILQVFPVLLNYIGEKPVIFHNAKFDYGAFLEPMAKNMFNRNLNWNVLCTLELSRMIVDSDKKDLATVYKTLTGKDASNQSHRASADALMTAEIAVIMQNYIRVNYDKLRSYLEIKLS